MQVSHLSSTQIQLYCQCPFKWYVNYVVKPDDVKKSPRMSVGWAFHRGFEHNFRQKHETRADLPVDDVLDVFSTSYEEQASETDFTYEDKGKIKDAGAEGVKLYHAEVAPAIQPVEVEQPFTISFKNQTWQFKGVLDVLTEDGLNVEMKTTKQTPPEPKFMHKLQATAYSLGIKLKNEMEVNSRIDYTILTKQPKVVTFPFTAGEGETGFFLRVLQDVLRGIEAEIWTPRRWDIMCSRKYCQVWHYCEAQNGGRVRD